MATTTTRQRLAGGVLVGVAALAFYFGTQWKGPGLGGNGTGDGGTGTNSQDTTPADTNSRPSTTDLAGDEAAATSDPNEPAQSEEAKPAALVTVVISGNEYLLSTTGDVAAATAVPLTEVARAALIAPGDGQGIRVRIFRKKDATAGAKLDLFSKLTDAGIPAEAIQDMREFLD